jgi:hypothetical protein
MDTIFPEPVLMYTYIVITCTFGTGAQVLCDAFVSSFLLLTEVCPKVSGLAT